MDAEAITTLIESLVSGEDGVEALYEKACRLASDALSGGTAEQAWQAFAPFYERSERIASFLGLDGPPEESRDLLGAFRFGQITALADLISDVAALEREREDAKQAAGRDARLAPFLRAVGGHPSISGTELREMLRIKSSGTLSRFIGRTVPDGLLYVQKIGASNRYRLTPKGRRYLRIIEGRDRGRS